MLVSLASGRSVLKNLGSLDGGKIHPESLDFD